MKKIVLQASHLTKKYGKYTAVDDLNMTLFEGDIYGLTGENGSGKSTLIHMIAGLTRPTDGCIFLFGSRDLVSQRSSLGTVTAPPALYPNMTARENLTVQCRLLSIANADDRIRTILPMTGLTETGRKKVRDFSSGMKQRLAVAAALLNDPRLLILDEPTGDLDTEGVRELHTLLLGLHRKYNITILISSHKPEELSRLTTRSGILHNGKLLEECTEQNLYRSRLIKSTDRNVPAEMY